MNKEKKAVRISRQEKRTLGLLIAEFKNIEIAQLLSIDEKTVCTYKLRLLNKLNCKTVIGLYLKNLKEKIVPELEPEKAAEFFPTAYRKDVKK